MTSNYSKMPSIVRLSYRKGDLIVKEGDYGVSIYKILKGKVLVSRESEYKEIPLATLGIGDIFGEHTFLSRATETRTASVRALEDVMVEVWHTETLSKEYDEMSPIIKYITDQILLRSIRMNNLIVKLETKDMTEKAGNRRANSLRDKRQFYRKKVDITCQYRPVNTSSQIHLTGRIFDISLEGLGMAAKRRDSSGIPHYKGDRFVVTTVLPNEQPLELEAKIVSIEKGEAPGELALGMSISQISPKAKQSLGFFLMP